MEQQQRSKQGVTLVCNVFDSVIHVVVIYSRAKKVGKSKRRENVGAVKIEGFLGLSKYRRNKDVCKVEETKVKDGESERERESYRMKRLWRVIWDLYTRQILTA